MSTQWQHVCHVTISGDSRPYYYMRKSPQDAMLAAIKGEDLNGFFGGFGSCNLRDAGTAVAIRTKPVPMSMDEEISFWEV